MTGEPEPEAEAGAAGPVRRLFGCGPSWSAPWGREEIFPARGRAAATARIGGYEVAAGRRLRPAGRGLSTPPVAGEPPVPVGAAGTATGTGPGGHALAVTAAACGLSVASIYYAQPLLPELTRSFHVPHAAATAVVTAGQVGYACGLALVVPLGDIVDRVRLASRLLVLAAPALLLAAAAPALWVLTVSAGLLGIAASASQVLVALTAAASPEQIRGRAVGTVMGGLTAGILLARVFAGAVTGLLGWRAVYVTAAVLVTGMAFALRAALPQQAPQARGGHYARLLAGTLRLAAAEPVLRRRCVYGFAAFASFSAFWTPSAFLLTGDPYHFGESAVGAFALAGLVGVLSARPAGRMADRGHARAATGVFLALMVASFVPLALGGRHLGALIAGAVLLDFGLRGAQTANQQQIYRLPRVAHSRVTTVYMTSYFIGGAVGSAASASVYAHFGWPGVCVLGAALAAAPLPLWAAERDRPTTRTTPVEDTE
ncbi:MAG: ynfM3 [Streptomyces oryziradicis]|nr:ynfM3 [Actinacidiphila oryziradicis]